MDKSEKQPIFIWGVISLSLFFVYLWLKRAWQTDLGTYLLCSGLLMTTLAGTYMGIDKYRNKYKGILLSIIWIFGLICFFSAIYISSENYRFITGGNSYCYLAPLIRPDDTFIVQLINDGEYPLYEVRAAVIDTDEIVKLRNLGRYVDEYDHIVFEKLLGDINAKSSRPILKFKLGKGQQRNFDINFSAHNGIWYEQARFNSVNNKWIRSITVTKGRGDNLKYLMSEPNWEPPSEKKAKK